MSIKVASLPFVHFEPVCWEACKKVCLWGLFAYHVQRATESAKPFSDRVVHGILAALEFFPILGQIVSLIEYVVTLCRQQPELIKKIEAPDPFALNAHNTRLKIEALLSAHVCHRKLTPLLVKRAFLNFLHAVEPRAVLSRPEPSQELLENTIKDIHAENFSTFIDLHTWLQGKRSTGGDKTLIFYHIIRAFSCALDPYTSYFRPLTVSEQKTEKQETLCETSVFPFNEEGVMGVLRIPFFNKNEEGSSVDAVRSQLEDLKKNDLLKGLILDLRDNPGGLTEQALAVAGLFLKKGVLASFKNGKGKIKHRFNSVNAAIYEGPLLVLTNRKSISGAELVAGVLQDYGRALVVGDPETFGKGTEQKETCNYVDTDGKPILKEQIRVTKHMFYTPSGRTPQGSGIKADILVPGVYAHIQIGERFSPLALEADSISSSFNAPAEALSSDEQQQIVTCYTAVLPELRAKSQQRISQNEAYQKFIHTTQQEGFDPVALDKSLFQLHQLTEALSIMQDLIRKLA